MLKIVEFIRLFFGFILFYMILYLFMGNKLTSFITLAILVVILYPIAYMFKKAE